VARCYAHFADAAKFQDLRFQVLLENATVHGRDWYKRLDAPVLTLDVTV